MHRERPPCFCACALRLALDSRVEISKRDTKEKCERNKKFILPEQTTEKAASAGLPNATTFLEILCREHGEALAEDGDSPHAKKPLEYMI